MSIDSIRLENANIGIGLDNPALAVGLSGIADWSDTMAFLDLMKMSRGWFDQVDGVYHWFDDLKAMGHFDDALDENGWPTYMPEHIDQFTTIWAWEKTGEFAESIAEQRAGTYVLRYDGQGEVEVYGGVHIQIVSTQPGKIVFENTTGETFLMSIRETDSEATGDYVRNISIVDQEYLELYETGAVFHPDYIEAYADLRELRYMDMLETNHSDEVALDDRPVVNDLTYMGGVPIEIVVALANQTGTDVWLNIPHLATDEYITFLATYLHEHLDPNLKLTVEYSNEVWNGLFEQASAMHDLGLAAFEGAEEYGYFETSLSYYGKRAAEVMQLFSAVFDGADSSQLVRVVGGLTGGEWLTQQALTAPAWLQADPDAYDAPANYFDAIAVTTYFGGDIVTNPDLLQTIKEAIEDDAVDANQVLAEMLRDPDVSSSLPNIADALAAHSALADEYDLALVSYEGGQHVHHLAGTDGDGLAIEAFMRAFVRSEEMGALYQELIDIWHAHGDGPFMNFGWIGAPNNYGSWSVKATYEDETPRAGVLETYNETYDVSWESRAGVHFQQGATIMGNDADEILTGTIQEDFLLGGSGDDLLVGGRGNDGLNGGDGEDEVLFSGARADYSVMAEGNGYRIRGLDGSDFVINVEWLTFESGEYFAFDSMELDAVPMEVLSQYVVEEDQVAVPDAASMLEVENISVNARLELHVPETLDSEEGQAVAPVLEIVPESEVVDSSNEGLLNEPGLAQVTGVDQGVSADSVFPL